MISILPYDSLPRSVLGDVAGTPKIDADIDADVVPDSTAPVCSIPISLSLSPAKTFRIVVDAVSVAVDSVVYLRTATYLGEENANEENPSTNTTLEEERERWPPPPLLLLPSSPPVQQSMMIPPHRPSANDPPPKIELADTDNNNETGSEKIDIDFDVDVVDDENEHERIVNNR